MKKSTKHLSEKSLFNKLNIKLPNNNNFIMENPPNTDRNTCDNFKLKTSIKASFNKTNLNTMKFIKVNTRITNSTSNNKDLINIYSTLKPNTESNEIIEEGKVKIGNIKMNKLNLNKINKKCDEPFLYKISKDQVDLQFDKQIKTERTHIKNTNEYSTDDFTKNNTKIGYYDSLTCLENANTNKGIIKDEAKSQSILNTLISMFSPNKKPKKDNQN